VVLPPEPDEPTTARPALVNGAGGVVAMMNGRPFSVSGFTAANGKIVGIDQLSEPMSAPSSAR
jgi:hypothetical protein